MGALESSPRRGAPGREGFASSHWRLLRRRRARRTLRRDPSHRIVLSLATSRAIRIASVHSVMFSCVYAPASRPPPPSLAFASSRFFFLLYISIIRCAPNSPHPPITLAMCHRETDDAARCSIYTPSLHSFHSVLSLLRRPSACVPLARHRHHHHPPSSHIGLFSCGLRPLRHPAFYFGFCAPHLGVARCLCSASNLTCHWHNLDRRL